MTAKKKTSARKGKLQLKRETLRDLDTKQGSRDVKAGKNLLPSV